MNDELPPPGWQFFDEHVDIPAVAYNDGSAIFLICGAVEMKLVRSLGKDYGLVRDCVLLRGAILPNLDLA